MARRPPQGSSARYFGGGWVLLLSFPFGKQIRKPLPGHRFPTPPPRPLQMPLINLKQTGLGVCAPVLTEIEQGARGECAPGVHRTVPEGARRRATRPAPRPRSPPRGHGVSGRDPTRYDPGPPGHCPARTQPISRRRRLCRAASGEGGHPIPAA